MVAIFTDERIIASLFLELPAPWRPDVYPGFNWLSYRTFTTLALTRKADSLGRTVNACLELSRTGNSCQFPMDVFRPRYPKKKAPEVVRRLSLQVESDFSIEGLELNDHVDAERPLILLGVLIEWFETVSQRSVIPNLRSHQHRLENRDRFW